MATAAQIAAECLAREARISAMFAGPEAIALRVHAQIVEDGLIREDGRTRLCDGLEVTEYRTAGLLLGNADIANSCGYEPAGVPEKVSQCYPSQADMPQAVRS